MNFIENHAIPKTMSAEEVKKATLEDNTLKKVIENLQKGRWNEHPRSVDTDTMKTFKKLRSNLRWTSVEGNEDGCPDKTPGKSSRTGASRSPGDGQDKAFDPRKGVVPGDRCTSREEGEEVHGLSSQHTSTGIIDGTVENVKVTGGTMATC